MQGGFGNQLFIYFAGLTQALRLESPLELDLSWYDFSRRIQSDETPREFLLDGFIEQSPIDIQTKTAPITLLEKLSNKIQNLSFQDYEQGWRRINDQVKIGSRLSGYFQSSRYFENISDLVLKQWSSVRPVTDVDETFFRALSNQDFIAIHVRRGDYTSNTALKFHGLAGYEYFSRSLEVVRHLRGDLPAMIFTDSPELVSKEFSRLPNSHVIDQKGVSELFAIKAMSQAQGIVMSNSSFSWWAGYLMSSATDSPVIAPRPWFSNGITPPGLLESKWISLGE